MAQQISGNDLQGWDGYIALPLTPVYGSATTFTYPADLTGILTAGDKIKVTNNGSTKYFYVLPPVTSSAGVSTVTITGGSDYSLVNAGSPVMANLSYSKMASPQAFPQWFNYTPTFAGWSVTPVISGAGLYSRFSINGRTCTVTIVTTNTTSNATTATLTLPVATTANASHGYIGHAVDNGGDTQAIYTLGASSNVLTAWKSTSTSALFGPWTASGAKGLRVSGFTYEF